jgi:hypothetical protein
MKWRKDKNNLAVFGERCRKLIRAMTRCKFYNEIRPISVSRENTPDRSIRAASVIIPWCSHEHSPVSEERTRVFGGANLLKCGGDFENKCQVDPEKRE